MVKLLRNRVRAFTLFETVITLTIVTAILSIGWLNFSVIKEKMLIDSASMQVKVILNQALRRASITNKLYLIDYYESDNLLIVKDQDGKVEKYSLPEGVKIYNLAKTNIEQTGYIAPKTITLRTKKFKKELRIQLKWGKINETS